MTNYREILRLRSLGINHTKIAEGMGISRQTVVTTLQRASTQGLEYRAAEKMSDREIEARLFPPEADKPGYKIPDYEWVYHKMAKPGVTLQLL
jgi:IS30 family transposase